MRLPGGRAATATAALAEAVATVQAATAEQARLEAERARLVYPVRGLRPWALLLAAFALLLWAGWRMTRAAEAPGQAVRAILAATLPSSSSRPDGEAVIDPDRSFRPVIVVGREVSQPQLAPPDTRHRSPAATRRWTWSARDCTGQAAARRRRLPPNLPATMAPPPRALIRIVPPEQVRTWLEEVEPKVLGHIEEA